MDRKNKIERLYSLAILGAILCFIGDMLLGCYKPLKKEGLFILFPAFSNEWAGANPIRFVIGAELGIIALLLFGAGFYAYHLQLKEKAPFLAKLFWLSSRLFVAVGTLYHCVFAMTEWVYNRLSQEDIQLAHTVSKEMFIVFIGVSGFAAVGFLMLSLIMWIAAIKGFWESKIWAIVNPLLFMGISILLATILPQNALTTGMFDWGQQSIGLFWVFLLFKIRSKNKSSKRP